MADFQSTTVQRGRRCLGSLVDGGGGGGGASGFQTLTLSLTRSLTLSLHLSLSSCRGGRPVSGRAQGTAVVPPWLTSDAQMVVVAGRVCVREEKRRCRGERERVAS